MQTGLYVAVSGQLALDRRMAAIANNVANAGTAGYRAEETHFESIVSRRMAQPTAFSSTGVSYLSSRAGGMTLTGNPLDVAIQGDGWLSIQAPNGIAYTRDGRMRLTAEGELQTLAGHAVLDAGGSPLFLDPTAKSIAIAQNGTVALDGKPAGTIGLFRVDLAQGYTRTENSAIVPARTPEAIASFASDGFAQGYIEGANVNSVYEMTRLIAVTRSFERLQAAIDDSQAALKNAIQTLGA
jgi:flagellar basal-body rod protein FlgF